MSRKPRIAVILDENTSGDGSRYESSKALFAAIGVAGGLPFGVPFLPEIIGAVADQFDGLVCGGGRFAYPDAWYIDGHSSNAPTSDRFAVEREIAEEYLRRDKPFLGICAGMQLLGCINGCRLISELQPNCSKSVEHDRPGQLHRVSLTAGTRLSAMVRELSLLVNSSHREALACLSETVVASARADDGVIEAIEVPAQSFAIGVQWHQELFVGTNHPGNRIFGALVQACLRPPRGA